VNYQLRPAEEHDFQTIFTIKKETLFPYVNEIWGWDDAIQEEYLRKNFDGALNPIQIVEQQNQSIGILQTAETENAIEIINIELLSQYQGRGVGSEILSQIISTATQKKIDIKLQVFLKNTAAQRLYKRLGFQKVSESEHHVQYLLKPQ